jgi:hypothetical protein
MFTKLFIYSPATYSALSMRLFGADITTAGMVTAAGLLHTQESSL